MNAPNSPSLLAHVPLAPRDPILGLSEAFNADSNPNKANLAVGVYYDDEGRLPLLDCVRKVEQQMFEQKKPHGYLPIDGLAVYDRAVQELVFGAECGALKEKRIVTVQALGGTGGLKVGADFLHDMAPAAKVWISDPSWENHRSLFENAGFTVDVYPYYDARTHGIDFARMLAALNALPAGSIVVLHACCHNPTGVDLDHAQWTQVLDAVVTRGLVPFLDLAYQGFGDGIDADAWAVRRFAEKDVPLFVSSSFSKSFSLYGERAGALSVVTQNSEQAAHVLSQLKRLARSNYSNPPMHGGQVVATVLTTPELRALWERELGEMRERIHKTRREFVDKLHERVPNVDFSFITRQRGMFSYSGLQREVVIQLRDAYSVYAVESGRICVAAINSRNVDYVVDSIAKIIG
ncbi:MAG TPA: amino acid aminotransferase [Burkholderiales bacterium]|nr:amino acid aminotransferase [Burkholderiales bacterium]